VAGHALGDEGDADAQQPDVLGQRRARLSGAQTAFLAHAWRTQVQPERAARECGERSPGDSGRDDRQEQRGGNGDLLVGELPSELLGVGLPQERVGGGGELLESLAAQAGDDAELRRAIADEYHRLGDYGAAEAVIAAGVDALAVHARKAWLNGLSPKENRDIPPLDYERVYRLKLAMPDVPVIINGGIRSIDEATAHLEHVDGVMLGRAAYQEPWRLLGVDADIFGEAAAHASMQDALEAMMPYIEEQLARGARLHAITRHFVGAFHAVPGARAFRRHLAEQGVKPGAGLDVLRDAIARVGAREPAEAAA